MPTTNTLLAHAHDYADRFGWAIIPVKGKKAACYWERYQRVRPSLKQRGGLFSIKGVTGLAIIPGEVSGRLRIRDFDRADAYNSWAKAHPDLVASLPTVRTRRGFHVYFRADIPEKMTYYDDGEMRAGKCIVLLPPSPHPEGGHYEWLVEPNEIIPWVADVAEAGLLGQGRASNDNPPVSSNDNSPVPAKVAEAIGKTLPKGYGQRHKRIWDFTRRLKGLDGLDTSIDALMSYIRAWHSQALPTIRTKSLLTSELAFLDAWEDAEVPLTDDAFWSLVQDALKQPDPEWFRRWFFPERGKALLRVCMALQEHAGNESFFLSARIAGEAVGISHKDANEIMRRLTKKGFLLLVEKGTYESRLASTWRYLGPPAYYLSETSLLEGKSCA